VQIDFAGEVLLTIVRSHNGFSVGHEDSTFKPVIDTQHKGACMSSIKEAIMSFKVVATDMLLA
jgi:hypothetical protein